MTDHDIPSEFTHPPTPPDEDAATPCEQAGPAPDQQGPALRGPTGAPIPGDASVRAQQGPRLTTPQGAGVADTDHALKAGPRGPTLLQDFHLREKMVAAFRGAHYPGRNPGCAAHRAVRFPRAAGGRTLVDHNASRLAGDGRSGIDARRSPLPRRGEKQPDRIIGTACRRAGGRPLRRGVRRLVGTSLRYRRGAGDRLRLLVHPRPVHHGNVHPSAC